METIYPTTSSNLLDSKWNFPEIHLSFYFFSSSHALDQYKLYDSHLERRDSTYNAIMRMVKMITNFARTG